MRQPKFVLGLAASFAAAAAGCGPVADLESTSAAVSVSNVHPENPGQKKFLTVMSRNLYIGADIFAPFQSPDPLGAATEVFNQVVASNIPGRARAVASEIAATGSDLVGLQEAFRIVVTPLGATEPILLELDFLDELADGLADLDLSYTVAAVEEHLDLTVPLPALGVQVRVLDRDAILADADVEVLSSGGGDFVARFETTLAGVIPVTVLRGWTEAEVRHEQVQFTFVNTHLEVKEFGPLQTLQAGELLARFGDAEQLVLVGDTNSAPTDEAVGPTAYELLAATFEDAWTRAGDGEGLTCCFDADITPPSRKLFERVDLVFATPNVEAKAAFRTGLDALGGRWPSDHAGVVAILRLDKLEQLVATRE